MTKRLLLILALSGAAFGQMTWQQCQDNATTELNNCVAAAQKTFDTQKATDLANYNDCIDPNSPRSSALAGCTGAATLRTILASIDATSSSSGSPNEGGGTIFKLTQKVAAVANGAQQG